MGEDSVCVCVCVCVCSAECTVCATTAAIWPATPTWQLKSYLLINAPPDRSLHYFKHLSSFSTLYFGTARWQSLRDSPCIFMAGLVDFYTSLVCVWNIGCNMLVRLHMRPLVPPASNRLWVACKHRSADTVSSTLSLHRRASFRWCVDAHVRER